MKYCFSLLLVSFSIALSAQPGEIQQVAAFRGQQVTGVTVSDKGTVFVNFPRWRQGVRYAVARIGQQGELAPFPNQYWNSWEVGDAPAADQFVGVQSVWAEAGSLYVLDTRNALFQGVLDAPRIFVFDLATEELTAAYLLSDPAYYPNSYINDLRVDAEAGFIYMTDSNEPGLVVLNTKTGSSRRVLDHHPSTTADADHLTIEGERWGNTVHSDGIALRPDKDTLYFHALTGYRLYALPTDALQSGEPQSIRDAVRMVAETAAPDGMIFDRSGRLYYADLENQQVCYRTPAGTVHVLAQGTEVQWADTFSIHEGYLYWTNSRINEVKPETLPEMEFSVMRVRLPD